MVVPNIPNTPLPKTPPLEDAGAIEEPFFAMLVYADFWVLVSGYEIYIFNIGILFLLP